MLDKGDLEAIARLIKESEDRMDVKLTENKRDIMQGVAVLMDERFDKKFD